MADNFKITQTSTLQDVLKNCKFEYDSNKKPNTVEKDLTPNINSMSGPGINFDVRNTDIDWSDYVNTPIPSNIFTTDSNTYWPTYQGTPANGTYTIPNYNYTTTRTNGPLVITDKDGKEWDVAETLKMVCDRLLIIGEPNEKLMEKYQALKEAYENYKLVEALLTNASIEDEE